MPWRALRLALFEPSQGKSDCCDWVLGRVNHPSRLHVFFLSPRTTAHERASAVGPGTAAAGSCRKEKRIPGLGVFVQRRLTQTAAPLICV